MKRAGRKSLSQTPAPKKEQIKGSLKNLKGSAKSTTSASKIKLSEKIIKSLEKKKENYNEKHNKDVSLNTLKAVMRRGMGAYSKTHRPTISGGAPNSRQAWGMARVNKFLEKKSGEPVKKSYVQDDDLLKYANGGLVASNGKPSNLTPEQYKLVRTPEFKAWFGDWENDPQNASKVVDENGEPLVVYHGTATDFNIFKVGSSRGIFFSNKKSSAELFSEGKFKRSGEKPHIKECFLYSLKPFYKSLTKDPILEKEYYENYFNERPFISEKNKKSILKKDNFKNEIIFFGLVDEDKKNKLIEFGYDGIVMDADNNAKSYIVFEPNQIKLADGTNTTFDSNSDDIRFDGGGLITNDNIEVQGLNNYTRTEKSGKFYNIFGKRKIGDSNYEMWWVSFSRKDDVNKFGYARYRNENDEEKIISLNELPKSLIEIYNNPDIKFDKGGLIAPNGNPSNLTSEQYKLVRTPEFKAWFGDWENDPQNASKVIDENGEPMVCYHRTDKKFTTFDKEKLGQQSGWATAYFGFYFSNKNNRGAYGKKIMKCFLNIRNPYFIQTETYSDFDYDYKRFDPSNFKNNDGIYIKADRLILDEKADKHFVAFEPNQIKLADGTNTTFDSNNDDIRFEKGGNMKNIEMELTKSLSVSDIDNKYQTLPHDFINKQLMKGIEVEMEHTSDPNVARKIALDHLYENPFYYEYLDKMEEELKNLDIDAHYNELMQGSYYAKGGETSGYEFTTPTKLESKLPYLQQVLVRTKAFKNWFGDWELAARLYLADGGNNFKKHYANVSKVVDMETLEPSLVFHGTSSEEEFYQFATNKDTGSGRPYGYFAINREYSMNFVGRSNLLYSAFLNIRNPFMARGEGYDNRKQDWSYWALTIAHQLIVDTTEKEGIKLDDLSKEEANELAKKYLIIVTSQVEDYIRKVYKNEDYNFWLLMARDVDSEFKRFLISHGYDGILANEQFKDPYDVNNPREYTNTCIIFDATQVKLADGRNLTFDPMNADIRFEHGGEMHEEDLSNSKKERMRKMALGGMYKSGGALKNDEGVKDDAKDGGLFVGRSHADGGIKAYNVSTQSPIEVEGGEVIITKKAVSDDTKREFEGEMLTNKEILSRINESGGGVSFEDGGEIHGCGCSGKKFNYGGEVLEDYMIIKKMNELYDATMGKTISYADSLVNKLK